MGTICFFNTAKAWGGGEKWHFEVSQYLYKQGYPILVIAHKKSELLKRLLNAQIPCLGIELSNLSFLNPIRHKELISIFKRYDLNAIVMNLSSDLKIAGVCAKKIGVNRIIYRRGSAIPIKNTFLNRYNFSKVVSEILTNSEATKQTILINNSNLFPKEKIKVIHNGIDTSQTIETSSSPNNSKLVLLNLGRLEFQKNQRFLIKLAVELKKRGLVFSMLIGGEGRLRKELEMQIENQGVSSYVELSGFIENPMEYINKADIFLLPSHWEGFGYVLAEAALCKKPIIAFNVSSNPELIVHGKTGYLIPKDDLQSFADRICELQKDKEKRIQFGLNGYSYIKENFDKNKQIKKIEDYLING